MTINETQRVERILGTLNPSRTDPVYKRDAAATVLSTGGAEAQAAAAEAQAEFWRLRCIAEAERKPAPPTAPLLRLDGEFICIGQIGDEPGAMTVRHDGMAPGILLRRDDGTAVVVLGLTEDECRAAAGGFLQRCSLVLHGEGAL